MIPSLPYLTTMIGSFPHQDANAICQRILSSVDVPVWPQLSRRSYRENMYAMFSAGLPGIMLDDKEERISFDTSGDLTPSLEAFYERYLADDVDSFALSADFAAGFHAMLDLLPAAPGEWIKGQVTGPISFGLTVTDQDKRASLYNDMLADTIVKNTVMIARWQIRQLRAMRPNVIIFVDEPYMASFGSAFISLGREQVVTTLNEVFDAIHDEGALAGVHCCANTDWSVLMETKVDLLNLDAYGYMDNLALYPHELRKFLDRGGMAAWGIVPNNAEIYDFTPNSIAAKFNEGLELISQKAQARGVDIQPNEFASRSLITPSCGVGPETVEIAEKVMDVLSETGEEIRQTL